MVELRWIQMSLFLMLLLQFTGANGLRSLLIGSGHDVTLPCENVINDQNKCNRTTWIFSGIGSETVELIELGQIHENVGEKSARLIVMENCSLVIKKVTHEDVGQYVCQQFNKSGGKLVSDSVVLLSVISMTEQKNNDEVTLNCSVSTFGQCEHRVKWLYRSQDVDKENTELRTSDSPCSASLHFKTSHFIYTSRFKSYKCEVTDRDKVQLFSFITGPSGEKPGKDSTTTTTAETRTISSSSPTTSNNNLSTNLKDLWWLFIIVALVLVALLIIVVKVVRRQRIKGKKTQMNDDIGLTSNPAETQCAAETSQDTADPEDGVSYASISYTKSHSKGRVKNKTVDDGDAVMYSTVKAPSIDPSSLYATIK